MSVRIVHYENAGPCSKMPNAWFEDKRLQFHHIGFLGYWLAIGAPERLSPAVVMENGNIGRDKYRKITRELREWGYLPISERIDNGRLNPREWSLLRVQVFERDGYACVYCGDGGILHCDHVVPVARGGSNEIENLATACAPCNLSKGDKLLSEWKGRAA